MNIYKKYFLLFSLVFLVTLVSFAQGPPGGPGGGDPPCWPPPCVPVDGGISFLLAIGAAYGAKKAFQHTKEEE